MPELGGEPFSPEETGVHHKSSVQCQLPTAVSLSTFKDLGGNGVRWSVGRPVDHHEHFHLLHPEESSVAQKIRRTGRNLSIDRNRCAQEEHAQMLGVINICSSAVKDK